MVIGLFVSLGFVEKKQDGLVCKNLIININEDDEIFFVQKGDIRYMLKNRGDAIINQPVQTINIPEIEKVINTHPSVSSAEVYMDVNGSLNIDIKQRKPLIRVINENNESYYIDTAGKLMLLSENYSAKVLVANGTINEPYAKRYTYSMEDILKSPNMRDTSVLDDLFALASYINKDKFWKAQVQQLYVNREKEFEIIPRVGDHVILLGDASDMDEKFKKLMTFYKEGMNKTGWWNNYSAVNLKYKNQIVCTKKEGIDKKNNNNMAAEPPKKKEKETGKSLEDTVAKKQNSPAEKKTPKAKNKKKKRKKLK